MTTPTVTLSELQKFTEIASGSFSIVEKQYQSVEKLLKKDFTDFKGKTLDQIEAIQKIVVQLQNDPDEFGFRNLTSLLKNLFHFVADYALGQNRKPSEEHLIPPPKEQIQQQEKGSVNQPLFLITPKRSDTIYGALIPSTSSPVPSKKDSYAEIPDFASLKANSNGSLTSSPSSQQRSLTQAASTIQQLSTSAQKLAPPRPPRTNVPVGSLSKPTNRAFNTKSVVIPKAFGAPVKGSTNPAPPPSNPTHANSTSPAPRKQSLTKKKSFSFHQDQAPVLMEILKDPILQKYALENRKIMKCQTCIRSWLKRKKFREVVRAFTETNDGKIAKQRLNVAKEIIETEKTYLASMKLLVERFVMPLKKEKILPDDVVTEIFKNCEAIVAANQFFLDGLSKEFAETRIGKVVLEIAPFFRIYTEYVSNYDIAHNKLQTIMKDQSSVANFFRKCESEARVQANKPLDLSDLMIQPIQRIPRYALLLQELLRCTPSDHTDRANLELALDLVKKLTEHINENKKQTERIRKIVEVQERIQGNFLKLVEPHRVFIAEGDLTKMWDNNQEELHFFLFNDVLVYCHTHTGVLSSKKTYKYVSFFLLARALVVDVEHTDKDKFCFAITYPQKNQSFVLATKTLQEKKQWISNIDAQIKAMEKSSLIVKEAQENNDFLRATTMRGFLIKQGGSVKNWKKRYFQLKGNSLFYYHTPEDTQPLGSIHLKDGETVNYTVKMASKLLHRNCIQLHSPNNRKYYLTADSPEVIRPWVYALKEIIPVDPEVEAAFPYKEEVTRISQD